MANSLQDQMLKAGLVGKHDLDHTKKQKHKQRKRHKGKVSSTPGEAAQLAAQAKAEQLARDRALNQTRDEDAQRRAIAAQVRQIVEACRIDRGDAEQAFNFTIDSKIKTIHLSAQLHRDLGLGRLGIAALGEDFEIVPRAAVERIRERAPESIVFHADDQAPDTDEDDAYAEYKIPDDLMW